MYLKNKELFPRRKTFLFIVTFAVVLFQHVAVSQNVYEKPEASETQAEKSAPVLSEQPSQKSEAPAKPDAKIAPASSEQSPKPESAPPKPKYLAGEDPEFATKHGWPVEYPTLLPGSIIPEKRIVAYYGNPRSKLMGALGQYPKDEMLARLKKEVNNWEKADPERKVQPALHLIAVVAQEYPGTAKKHRNIMPDEVIEDVYGWAKEAGAILFIDLQLGLDDIRELLPRFEWILKNPDVHLALDPEFSMLVSGKVPGKVIGTNDAKEINYASEYLRGLVKKYNLPPKIFVIHRFTHNMLTNTSKITLSPEVAIVINMDGWGSPSLKRATYRDVVVRHPVQFTGFKLFYRNDTKNENSMLEAHQILRLVPTPLYIQYQ